MAKFFRYRFAVDGDRTAIPEGTDPSGFVSYQQGFGFDYERDPVSDPLAKNIPRNESNQLYYDITDAIRQYQTHGVPDFITTSDNGGTAFPYDKFAKVLYDDGGGIDIFTSLVTANTALPSDATKWRKGEGGITNLIGDVVANGPGVATATIQNNAVTTAKILAQNVTLAKIAAQAANTILANATAGAASPTAVAVAAQRLFGRGQSGNLANIEVSNDFAFLANVLTINTDATIAENGAIRLLGGILLKWGVTVGALTTPGTVTFPTPFPNGCFNVQLSINDGVGLSNNTSPPTTKLVNANGFAYEINHNAFPNPTGRFMWFAIGY